jgi:hypothetical protein
VSRSRRAITPIGRLAVAAAMVGLSPAVAACDAGNNAPTTQYHVQSAGVDSAVQGIDIRDAFVLGAPNAAPLAAGQSAGVFLALYNNGSSADRLLSVTAPGTAKSVVLPTGGISLGADQAVYLTGPKPKIVLTGILHNVTSQSVRITLDFLNAGTLTLTLPVLPRTDDYATFLPPPSPSPSPTGTATSKNKHGASTATPTAPATPSTTAPGTSATPTPTP